MKRIFLVLAIVTYGGPAVASQVSGHGKAIDSTIIQVDEQRIMLFGVDSVMRKQTCRLDGKPWQCWTAAVNDLQKLLDQGPVTCTTIGAPDIYGRLLAKCDVNNQSVNEQLVRQGFAVARVNETNEYASAEASARAEKTGLWQGQFVRPSDFRRAAGIFVERP
jgi:endonuclease YncB( thermonuclease family)